MYYTLVLMLSGFNRQSIKIVKNVLDVSNNPSKLRIKSGNEVDTHSCLHSFHPSNRINGRVLFKFIIPLPPFIIAEFSRRHKTEYSAKTKIN